MTLVLGASGSKDIAGFAILKSIWEWLFGGGGTGIGGGQA